MNKPKMILFDFGQTLMNSEFDPIAGTNAVLSVATGNPDHVTAEEIQVLADAMKADFGTFEGNADGGVVEAHMYAIQNYLYEYFHLEFDLTNLELNELFTTSANNTSPTPGIAVFLNFLERQKIRTGVVSNMGYSGEVLKNWVNRVVPGHHFEFILASSEYIFRKPHRRFFELALRKTRLPAADVWYCGDNPIADVDGSAAVGITPVWYKGVRKSSATQPKAEHLEVQSWEELANIIRNDCINT